MTEFRKSLIALTQPVKEKPAEAEDEAAKTPDEQKPRHRKLVIVVDELDRCRPDYALSLLELIKHFFDVPHVHFVLGVNMRELENSVKARYGGGINAGLYLQKFVTLTMGLPTTTNAFEGKSLSTSYFEKNSARVGINQAQHEYILGVLDTVIDKESLTLRAIQRLIALLQITTLPDMSFQDELLEKVAASSLSILRVIRPQTYKDIHTGKIDLVELQLIFEMSAEGHRRANRLLFDCWQLFLQPAEYTKRMGYTLDTAPSAEDQLKRIHQLKMRHLEVFELRGSL
ncbi:MAG: P-loop NTPase fold protein [Sulfitobacter sp.]|nr:P-loop NTPase fold protein [Sulfitobacter sp.]